MINKSLIPIQNTRNRVTFKSIKALEKCTIRNLRANSSVYPSSSNSCNPKHWLTFRILITAIITINHRNYMIHDMASAAIPDDNKSSQLIAYLVRNCRYNCGFAVPWVLDLSLDARSKNTVKQVLLSRPHIFHNVVLPSPITVSETAGPFWKYTPQTISSTRQSSKRKI